MPHKLTRQTYEGLPIHLGVPVGRSHKKRFVCTASSSPSYPGLGQQLCESSESARQDLQALKRQIERETSARHESAGVLEYRSNEPESRDAIAFQKPHAQAVLRSCFGCGSLKMGWLLILLTL